MSQPERLSGRRAEAARNDSVILDAARTVFVDDPAAPIAAVALAAGVGISALYHRYASKDALLAKLCADGQDVYLREVERALAETSDPWDSYVRFLRRIVDANTHALTVRLAGRFTPTPEHQVRAQRMLLLGTKLFHRAQASGKLRADLTFLDTALLLELVACVRLGDAQRTAELRQRYLTVILAGMTTKRPANLPGEPPTWEEQLARWGPVPDL
jgi:AcrR family transcriptional regulator